MLCHMYILYGTNILCSKRYVKLFFGFLGSNLDIGHSRQWISWVSVLINIGTQENLLILNA